MTRTLLLLSALVFTPAMVTAQMSQETESGMENADTMPTQPSEGAMNAGGTMSDAGGMTSMEGMEAPDPLFVYFDTGSARISTDQAMVLDRAVRTFRDGDWVVIEVSGVADTVGDPAQNLTLSLARAQSVATELMARGVDPVQLQIRARGNSELAVRTGDETPEKQNRIAEITWR